MAQSDKQFSTDSLTTDGEIPSDQNATAMGTHSGRTHLEIWNLNDSGGANIDFALLDHSAPDNDPNAIWTPLAPGAVYSRTGDSTPSNRVRVRSASGVSKVVVRWQEPMVPGR